MTVTRAPPPETWPTSQCRDCPPIGISTHLIFISHTHLVQHGLAIPRSRDDVAEPPSSYTTHIQHSTYRPRRAPRYGLSTVRTATTRPSWRSRSLHLPRRLRCRRRPRSLSVPLPTRTAHPLLLQMRRLPPQPRCRSPSPTPRHPAPRWLRSYPPTKGRCVDVVRLGLAREMASTTMVPAEMMRRF